MAKPSALQLRNLPEGLDDGSAKRWPNGGAALRSRRVAEAEFDRLSDLREQPLRCDDVPGECMRANLLDKPEQHVVKFTVMRILRFP